MIKNKKAMSKLIITMVMLVLTFVLFLFLFPGKMGDISKQVKEKLSISQYLPSSLGEKLSSSKEHVSPELSRKIFYVTQSIFEDKNSLNQPTNSLKKGTFYLIKKQISDDESLIGFTKFNGEYRLYTTSDSTNLYDPTDLDKLKELPQANFEGTIFSDSSNKKLIMDLIKDKTLVVMPKSGDWYSSEVLLFLSFIVDKKLVYRSSVNKLSKQYPTLESLLEKNVVDNLAFSMVKKSNLYWNKENGDQIHDDISKRSNDYFLIYRYFDKINNKDYVVFFPLDSYGARISDNNIYGSKGRIDNAFFEDLEKQKLVVKMD